jgi:hyperosmotically inducible protein
MKTLLSLMVVVIVGTQAGCSSSSRSADVSGSVRASLDQAGLKDVSVTEDVNKGVLTLSGHVAVDADKSQAESIAKSRAGAQVVSNQIAVNSDLDKRIAGSLDAALIQGGLHTEINYAVKNQVVTMTGQVDSQSQRVQAQEIAGSVPNVQQVVNELQVKEQKATSSN